MALLFVDSFDHYATADLPGKYSATGGATIISSVTREPRNGPQCCRFLVAGSSNLSKKFLAHTTWIMGIGIKLDADVGGSLDHDIFQVIDHTESTVSDTQVSLQYNFDKKFRVVRGSEIVGTVLATSDGTFDLDDGWHFIEFKCVINNTIGSFDAQLDGVQIQGIETTGVDTRNGANDLANGITIRPVIGVNSECLFDDLYIANGAPPGIIDFLGDIKIDALFPRADGNYEEFTPSSGTDAFALVNTFPPDADTTYVEENTDVKKSSFLMDTAGNFAIKGVQETLYIRKTDVNRRKIKHLTRIGGADHKGPDVRMGETFNMKTKMWETSPKTGSQWTAGEVNGSEFGMEVAS